MHVPPAAHKPPPKERRKASLPDLEDDPPLMGLRSQRDWVAGNVVEAAATPHRFQEQEEVGWGRGRMGGTRRRCGWLP